ncbi:kinase-like protein [Phaeosphaeriaceae sp. SRC1lsM3a]|nr:kinase-like protein [Stagonospora sp. SRC1lsM3a]
MIQQSPQKFGSRNPWSESNWSLTSSHAPGSVTSSEPSPPTYTNRVDIEGTNAKVNTDEIDSINGIGKEHFESHLADDDSNTSQYGQRSVRIRHREYDPRISWMFAAHQQALQNATTGELIDVKSHSIAAPPRLQATNRFMPRLAQAYSSSPAPGRFSTPWERNPWTASDRLRAHLKGDTTNAVLVPIRPLSPKRAQGSFILRPFLEAGTQPQATAHAWRRPITHNEAGTRRAYSHSIVSDMYGDDLDTMEEEEDEDSKMNDFIDDECEIGHTSRRLGSTLQMPMLHDAQQYIHDATAQRNMNHNTIETGQPGISPAFVEGGHQDIDKGDSLPFRFIDKLGVGATATVDIVETISNGRVFAHKAFRPYSGRDKLFKATFKNEIDIMKKLNPHPHIVKICWSYTRGREIGMLLAPVASDKDLGTYLLAIHDAGRLPTAEQERTLLEAFGCLANGLAYIHSHTIRHKDIKPQNILVHDGRMIYTDFGIALDASNQATTTTGMAEAFTKRYCAPEVMKNLPRNRNSDIFSLGCVFLEILAVLIPSVDVCSSDPHPYCVRIDIIKNNFEALMQQGTHHRVAKILPICVDMIHDENAARIQATAIIKRLVPSTHGEFERYFCSACSLAASVKP